jgi:ribosomal protein L7/L12
MSVDEELSPEVVSLLQQGRKIAAIKQARKDNQLGLKEAKDLVEGYMRKNPALLQGIQPESNNSGLILVVLLLGAVYLTYQFLN